MFTEAAILAHPKTVALATDWTAVVSTFWKAFMAYHDALRDVVRSEAVVSMRNLGLDADTMDLSRLARAVDKGEYHNKLFAERPSVFIRRNLRVQCERTKNVVLPALLGLPEGHALRALADGLATDVVEALKALDARSEKKGARQLAANVVDEWKEDVNVLRITTYAELLKIGIDTNVGAKAFADAFFRQDSEDSTAAVDEPPTPT